MTPTSQKKGAIMSLLKIALLGSPQVYHLSRRLPFGERKALALLAYLATEGGLHKREKLRGLLWPESDRAHGRTMLRATLLRLRQLLEEKTAAEQTAHLLVSHDALGLDLDSGIDLDLHALEAVYRLMRALPSPEAVQEEARGALIVPLERAARLYRGSFLQDFTLRETLDFDNWVSLQQGYWYQQIEQVFDWLSQLQRAAGELEQAIATVERWRSFDPLNEDISLRLMQFQFATGNRIAALKTYHTYLEVLRKELGAKPSPKLVALAEVLRTSSSPGRKNSHAQPPGLHASSARPFLPVPFVGRGAELSRLMSLYEQASCGQPQVVLLEGEAGIGKSCLAAAFLEWVRAQGAEVLVARTVHASQGLSYQPLLEALRPRLEQEPALRQWLGDPWLAELSRVLPDLRERYPDLPPPTIDGAFASCHLFEALARLSHALAAQAPLFIFADDIQWTDKATLDVLQYLARSWTEHATPALLLLGRRTETRAMEPQMAQWLASLRNTVSLTCLQLGPLSAKDILQIVRSLSGVEGAQPLLQGEHTPFQPSWQPVQAPGSRLSPERFGAWLFTETRGQPFYLRALLEMLLERGVLVPRSIGGSGWVFEPHPLLLDATPPDNILPPDVRELIQRRLARLSSPARLLLAAGAVLEQDFTFEELCQVAQLCPQEGLAALDEALQCLLLQESSHRREASSGVCYHFAHNKIRQVVYAEAGDARRRVFHGRALAVPGHVDVPTAELAAHVHANGSAALTFR
jgi:DNA-binding SARP family transcriptional activator